MVLGVPTVKRDKQSYLVNTLSSLLYSLTSSQSQDLVIVVFVAEVTHMPPLSLTCCFYSPIFHRFS